MTRSASLKRASSSGAGIHMSVTIKYFEGRY
jgi:hypothetical protein